MDRGAPVSGRTGGELDTRARRDLRERQKGELRRERDRLLLDLAASLGTDGLARSLGTSTATAEKMLQGARGRLSAAPRRISARRLSGETDRWGEADRHYEALGRSVRWPALPPHGS